jgi:hypothetical protein
MNRHRLTPPFPMFLGIAIVILFIIFVVMSEGFTRKGFGIEDFINHVRLL